MDEMQAAHTRDMQEQREIRDARHAIETFLKAPHRLHTFTRQALEHAVEQLHEDEQRTVRRWN